MGDWYALGSALCFALSNVMVVRGAHKGVNDNGAFLSLLLTAAISAAVWLLTGMLRGFPAVTATGLLCLAAAGVFTGYVGRVFLYASIQHVGAIRASAIKRLNPVFAVLLGTLVLGDTVTGIGAAGMLLILVSVAVLAQGQLRGAGGWRELLNLGYLYGPVSALGYAFGYLLRKAGLSDTPDPFFGAMIGSLVAAALFVATSRVSEKYRLAVTDTFRRPSPWLYGSGILASFGQILYFAALNTSPMSRVAVLASIEVFITIALSLAFFGERLTARVALAASLGVGGMALLVRG